MKLKLALASLVLTPVHTTSFDDDGLETAVTIWLANESSATSTYGAIADWDIKYVTSLKELFVKTAFNGDVGKWDVSQVTTMRSMFFGATAFNGDLGDWDVSKVADMGHMFAGSSFNGDLVAWDVSSATDMGHMFYYSSLHRALGWIIGESVDLADAFAGTACAATSCGVSVRTVGDFSFTEPKASSSRRLAACDDINAVHAAAASCGLKACYTNDGLVTAVSAYISGDTTTYGDIATWDLSCVTDMSEMFNSANDFNADLGDWDVSKVTNMELMFALSSFNGDLVAWDVSSATDMGHMFYHSSLDLALGWTVGEGVDLADAFAGTACAATSCGVSVEMVGDFSFAEPQASSSRRLATCDNVDAVHAAAASYGLVCEPCITNDGLKTAVADVGAAEKTHGPIATWASRASRTWGSSS
jgi:surface protein